MFKNVLLFVLLIFGGLFASIISQVQSRCEYICQNDDSCRSGRCVLTVNLIMLITHSLFCIFYSF